jgi:hypothetical protein
MSSRIAQTQIAQVSRVLREPAANIATFLKGCWRIPISLWMAGIGQKLRELWRRRAGAAQQALRLLTENLSPLQRDQLALFNYFDVIGGDTGTRYRIYSRNQMNVEAFDKRGRRLLLCFMPKGRLPIGDTMLAQKIALELFERDTVQIANVQVAWD